MRVSHSFGRRLLKEEKTKHVNAVRRDACANEFHAADAGPLFDSSCATFVVDLLSASVLQLISDMCAQARAHLVSVQHIWYRLEQFRHTYAYVVLVDQI